MKLRLIILSTFFFFYFQTNSHNTNQSKVTFTSNESSKTISSGNKPTVGDFGIRYSINFNGIVTQGFSFSGLVCKQVEIGTTIAFNYHTANSLTTDSVIVKGVSGNLTV